MEDTPELEQNDIVDKALSKIYDLLLSDEETDDDEAFEECSDIIYDVIGDLVDSEKIQEIPDEEASEESKIEWVKTAIPLIEAEILKRMEDESDDDSEESDDLDFEEEE